jgi:tryptophan synthase alpha chain
MNRIDQAIANAKQENNPTMVSFLMAGDPSIDKTLDYMNDMVDGNVDIIELGMPFSDPMADGEAVQKAAIRSLKNKTTIYDVFELVKSFRNSNTTTPIILMGYYNIVYAMGESKFIQLAKDAGVDGFIIVDLPFELATNMQKISSENNLHLISIITPATPESRIKKISTASKGFIYYVSVKGVTGDKSPIMESVKNNCNIIKKYTDTAIMIGFGIKTNKQAKEVCKFGDGFVVGSIFCNEI